MKKISSRQTEDASTQTKEDTGLPPCNCKKNLVAISIRRLLENVPDNRLMEFLNDVEILVNNYNETENFQVL